MKVKDLEDAIEQFGPGMANLITEDTEVIVEVAGGHLTYKPAAIVFNGQEVVILV